MLMSKVHSQIWFLYQHLVVLGSCQVFFFVENNDIFLIYTKYWSGSFTESLVTFMMSKPRFACSAL